MIVSYSSVFTLFTESQGYAPVRARTYASQGTPPVTP